MPSRGMLATLSATASSFGLEPGDQIAYTLGNKDEANTV